MKNIVTIVKIKKVIKTVINKNKIGIKNKIKIREIKLKHRGIMFWSFSVNSLCSLHNKTVINLLPLLVESNLNSPSTSFLPQIGHILGGVIIISLRSFFLGELTNL